MLEIDYHEPVNMQPSISQVIPCKVSNLNDEGWADYKWMGADGVHHWERKQWGELTGGLDSIEQQLRLEYQNHRDAHLGLIVEGVATPSMMGTQLWARSKGKDVIYRSRDQRLRYAMVSSWLYQIGKFIEVHYTSDLSATAAFLCAAYQSDQKESHGTFERYLRPISWNPNPQVEMLAALGHGIGIGPAKAEAIIKQYGTVWNVLSTEPHQLAGTQGVGKVLATKLLRKVGRADV